MTTIIRAKIAHTPKNSFLDDAALETFEDGAVAFADGRILACGAYREIGAHLPDGEVIDARDAILLPGFVDCHVHYPQLHVIGAMGLELLDWLRLRALPEEERLADEAYAVDVANRFVRALAANGTTTALVFGSHFPAAQEALFSAAESSGLRITSGLVVSDRNLVPQLHTTPDAAAAASSRLIERWHGRGLLRYAVSPRFAVSCSDEMLQTCGELARSHGDLFLTTHVNENMEEIARVRELFPGGRDYLETYERHGLVSGRSVFAHDVHVSDGELARLAGAQAAVAHCPSSNALLGSGLFPLRRHLAAGVNVALGTDIGAGASFSLFNEGLTAYQLQRVSPEGMVLGPAQLLWLATGAGAAALGLDGEIGDLTPGKSADFVLVRPPTGSTLETVIGRSESLEAMLGAVFTLAREESIAGVWVAGRRVL
jgi:guanine deaminase